MDELSPEEARRRGEAALNFARQLQEDFKEEIRKDPPGFPDSLYRERIPNEGVINRIKRILAWLFVG